MSFLERYYPGLFNLTSDKSDAKKHRLADLVDMRQTDTCHDSAKLDIVKGKIGLVSRRNATENCTVAQRALYLEVLLIS